MSSSFEGSYGDDSQENRYNIDSEFLKHVNDVTNEIHHLFPQATEEEIQQPMRQLIMVLQYQGNPRYLLRAQSCNDRWFIQELTKEEYDKIYMQSLGLGPLADLAKLFGGGGNPQAPNTDRLRKIMEAANSLSDEDLEDVARQKAKRDSKDDEGMEAMEEELVSEDEFKKMMEGSS